MKKHSQWDRFMFAFSGLRSALKKEASLQTEAAFFVGVLAHLVWKQPPLFWWIVILLGAAMVFVAELMNTAIENVCDALHPDQHPLIGVAKDCASAGVLVANAAALFLLFLYFWKT